MESKTRILRALFRSEADYHRAEKWWQDFWAQLPGSERWQSPWLKTAFADGTPMLDGDGILSSKQPELARALKIIQEEDEDVHGRIIWWKQTWDPDDENLTILVIAIVPSEESLEIASELLRSWAEGGAVDDSGDRCWAAP